MSSVYAVQQQLIIYHIIPRWMLLFGREYVHYDILNKEGFAGEIVFFEGAEHGYFDIKEHTDNHGYSYSVRLTQKAVDFFNGGYMMGYRSNVRSLIYGEPELVDALLAKELLLGNDGIQKLFDEDLHVFTRTRKVYVQIPSQVPGEGKAEAVMRDVRYIDLNQHDVKWYDSYREVQRWHALLVEAKEMGLDYEFIRVGEDVNDIDSDRTDGADWILSTYTSIEADI